MSGSRDYVRATSKKRTGARSGGGSKSNGAGDNRNYIKLAVVLIIAVCALSAMVYMRINANSQVKNRDVKETPKQNITEQKPTEKYSYRKLLEEKEIKTSNSHNKPAQSKPQRQQVQHELIIDRNPNLSELQREAKKETKEQEAQRALDILNGSLNKPREQVHTVRITPNGKATILDPVSDRRTAGEMLPKDTKVTGSDANPSGTKTSDNVSSNAQIVGNKTTSRKPNDYVKNQESKSANNQNNDSQTRNDNSNKKVESNTVADKNKKIETAQTKQETYFMQCGAFKTNNQASVLQGKIASKGQRASIQKADTKNGIWYRVILGPYASKSIANEALTKLKSSKIVSSCNVYKSK
jgi:cell division protein FtsN